MSAEESYIRSPSTTWEWRKVKMRRPAGGPSSAGAKHASQLPRWRARSPLSVTVRYHGGPEAWWCIKARGREWRFPGHLAFHDVMREIFNNDEMA